MPIEPAINRRFPRDEIQVVRNGRVIFADTKPLFAWMRQRPWHLTRVHLIGPHGRSDCGHVELKQESKLKRYKVSRQLPEQFMLCQHCNWYGQHRPYGS